jgi:hypothetical protein
MKNLNVVEITAVSGGDKGACYCYQAAGELPGNFSMTIVYPNPDHTIPVLSSELDCKSRWCDDVEFYDYVDASDNHSFGLTNTGKRFIKEKLISPKQGL